MIDEKKLIDHLQRIAKSSDNANFTNGILSAIDAVNYQEKAAGWIPVKYHVITQEEREREDFPEEWVYYFDCKMPGDEQEILITTKSGNVEKDTCCIDDSFYLDSGYDWIEDVLAWMPLPESYKGE